VLHGIRVVDLSTEIAGPYCTKMLADAGADVVKVEPPGGDPLRGWRSGGLFEYLNASKRSVTDEASLLGAADVLIDDRAVDVAAVRREHPHLVVVTITPFGLDGPWVGRPATEFTLQAACGSTGSRGLPDGPPLAAGGRLGDWMTGTYAAFATLSALHAGRGEHIDVAMFDCMAVSLITCPSVWADFMGWPPMRGTGRTIEVPSVEPTKDGWVVLTTNSGQQFQDFLVQIGRPDLLDDAPLANALQRFKRREEFLTAVHAYTAERTTADVLRDARDLRVPAGPVLDGSSIAQFEQFEVRQVFRPGPSGRFRQPRPPYALSGVATTDPGPVPAVGEHAGRVAWNTEPRSAAVDGRRPLAGVRIVDLTAWWAGPTAGHALACLGADVIKVESPRRPDGMRFASSRPPTGDNWWEWGPIYHAANAGKRGITLDLATPEGIAAFESLARTADVVLENFTPRVMDQFGLSWERLHELNDRLVMVRMPAFGLDGPWRDASGFAQTMECIAGIASLTGFDDGPPVLVRGACDPLAGIHAAFASVLALRVRDRDGCGLLVESTMVEAALNIAAEQVIEYDVTGEVLSRHGNGSEQAAPQNVYRCAGEDSWIAIAVVDDDQWASLVDVIADSSLTATPELVTAAGRRREAKMIDARLAEFCAGRDATELSDLLASVGVPAAVVISARDVVHNPQLQHRRVFEPEDHPVTGAANLPTMPFRFASIDQWTTRPSPTLGQHNDEVLGDLLGADAVADLRRAGVVGEQLG